MVNSDCVEWCCSTACDDITLRSVIVGVIENYDDNLDKLPLDWAPVGSSPLTVVGASALI